MVTKENLVFLKKKTQNQLVSQTTQNILERNYLKTLQTMVIKKTSVLIVRKNLKVEMIDLKASLLKNIAKKELKSKIF